MGLRPLLIFGAAILIAVLALTLWAWFQIPDGARIATHWNHGQVNGYMDKMRGLLIGPAIMVVVTGLFLAIAKIEPRRNNLARTRDLFAVSLIGTLFIVAFAQCHIVLTALGIHSIFTDNHVPALAILIIAIGNVLGKSRSNFFMGIRTPWTLESDYSCEKTHRWAGRFFVLAGIVALASFLAFGDAIATKVLLYAVLASVATATVLSYLFWRQDPERRAHDSVPE